MNNLSAKALVKGFIPAITLMALCYPSTANASFKLNFDEAGNGSYQTWNGSGYDASVNDPGVIVNGHLSYWLPASFIVTGAVEIDDSIGLSDILNFITDGSGNYYMQFLSGPGAQLADSSTFPDGLSGPVGASEDARGKFTYVAGSGDPAFTNFYIGHSGAGAVPEPATWAMMLLGFGAVGLTVRRRRKQTPNALPQLA